MGDRHEDGVSRRRLLTGLGVAGGGALLGAGLASPAGAQEGPTSVDGPPEAVTSGSPIESTIASAPVAGMTYEYVTMWDFTPEGASSNRAWGGFGTHTVGSQSTMWATVPLPAGAVLYDIEWYVRNASTDDVSLLGRFWRAGTGTMGTAALDITHAPSGSGTVARRGIVPTSANGPHPNGVRLGLGIRTTVDGSVQVNGARVGYREGNSKFDLLPTPIRAYDSRVTGGKLGVGELRQISLASAVPAGAAAALINLSVTETTGTGTVRVAAGGTTPPVTSVQWSRTGDKVTNAVTSKVSSSRQIAVQSVASNGTAHLLVDVIGFYA